MKSKPKKGGISQQEWNEFISKMDFHNRGGSGGSDFNKDVCEGHKYNENFSVETYGTGGNNKNPNRDKKQFKSGAHKDIQGKLRLDLVPLEIRQIFAAVLQAGIAKGYGERDWEKGIPLEQLLAAMERHELEVLAGHEIDVETKLPHIYHMAWNAMAAAVLYMRKNG